MFKNATKEVIQAGGWDAVIGTMTHHATEEALVALATKLLTFLVPCAENNDDVAASTVTRAMVAYPRNLELQMVRARTPCFPLNLNLPKFCWSAVPLHCKWAGRNRGARASCHAN